MLHKLIIRTKALTELGQNYPCLLISKTNLITLWSLPASGVSHDQQLFRKCVGCATLELEQSDVPQESFKCLQAPGELLLQITSVLVFQLSENCLA